MKPVHAIVLGSAFLLVAGAGHAELIDRGNGTIYDSTQDITWLKDWNLNGAKTFSEQLSWAENLTFAGGSDWTLPTISQYLNISPDAVHGKKLGSPFTNVVLSEYFSTTEVAPGSINVWTFSTNGVFAVKYLKGQRLYAVAIHPGDLAAAVPEPSTYALALVGLCIALARAKQKQGKKYMTPR